MGLKFPKIHRNYFFLFTGLEFQIGSLKAISFFKDGVICISEYTLQYGLANENLLLM